MPRLTQESRGGSDTKWLNWFDACEGVGALYLLLRGWPWRDMVALLDGIQTDYSAELELDHSSSSEKQQHRCDFELSKQPQCRNAVRGWLTGENGQRTTTSFQQVGHQNIPLFK